MQVTDYKYIVHNRSNNTVYIVDVIYTSKIRCSHASANLIVIGRVVSI